MTIVDPATIGVIGAGVGSAIGALVISLRNGWTVQQTAKTTEATAKTTAETAQTTKSMQEEINGPGDAPSLRQMIRDNSSASLEQYSALHRDIVLLNVAQEKMAVRVEKIEQAKGETLIATTLSAIHENCRTLTAEAKRTRLNLHKIANVVQVKLYTLEEADALAEGIGTDKQ